jgi:CHAD domain-containing protein/CYTH domain-containing protein
MTDLPPDLLARPVEEGARLLALSYLDEAVGAVSRVLDASDPEGLHDFRVALRRLRSVLRAYRPWLRTAIKRKLRDELRGIAAATGSGRDAEVLLSWVRSCEDGLKPRERSGVRWLARELAERRDAGYAAVAADVIPRFRVLEAKLRARLSTYAVSMRVGEARPVRTLSEALGALVTEHAAELGDQLSQIGGPDDEERAHEARIAAKRLRYLVEPLRGQVEGGRALVKRVKALQDVLGNLHDLHVLARETADAVARAAVERARRLHEVVVAGAAAGSGPEAESDERPRSPGAARTTAAGTARGAAAKAKVPRPSATPRTAGHPNARRVPDAQPGLLALATRVRAAIDAQYATLRRDHLGQNIDALVAEARRLGDHLTAMARQGREVERKYLLRQAPPEALAAPASEIVQGYLPGEKLVERLRKTTAPDGTVRCFRTVKVGSGLVRLEVEEETDPALFARLWPLTRGRRVRKRRHVVREGNLAWEVDVFTDRALVLAEVELPGPEVEVQPPPWLAPYVEREVTGEAAYVNAALAK